MYLLTVVLLDSVLEEPGRQMAPGIHSDNLLGISPLREGANLSSRLRVGEVGSTINEFMCWFRRQNGSPMLEIKLFASNSQGIVDGVRTTAASPRSAILSRNKSYSSL